MTARKRELRAGRPRAARALAPAPAAALAGRAARERLRDRGRRAAWCWWTPGSTSPARCASSSSRSTRPGCASSTCGCWSAPTPTRTTTGWPAPIMERPGCELWMHPNHAHMTQGRAAIPSAPSSGASRSRARAACRPTALEALQGGAPRPGVRHRRDRDARPRPGARRGGGDRPRRLAGLRDARPRALARRAPPARARGCCCRATTCSAASRSTTTTAGRRIPPASSWRASTWWTGSTSQLILAGHGRPVREARALVAANRRAVHERIERGAGARSPTGPRTPFEIVPEMLDARAARAA